VNEIVTPLRSLLAHVATKCLNEVCVQVQMNAANAWDLTHLIASFPDVAAGRNAHREKPVAAPISAPIYLLNNSPQSPFYPTAPRVRTVVERFTADLLKYVPSRSSNTAYKTCGILGVHCTCLYAAVRTKSTTSVISWWYAGRVVRNAINASTLRVVGLLVS
jgi:hypothetical protein